MPWTEYLTTANVAQGFGIGAMLIAFIGLIQKDDSNTLKIIMFSSVFWIIHFYLMGILAGTVAASLGLIRTLLSLKYKRNKRIFYGVVSATIVFGAITYTDHVSLLPILGACISAYGCFFFERVRMRAFMVVSSLFWFTFNLNIGSIGGIMNEIMVQTILIIAMYKMIHEEGKRVYFVDRVMGIIAKKESFPDVGRYVNIYDYIRIFKLGFKNKYKRAKERYKKSKLHKILNTEIQLFPKKKKENKLEKLKKIAEAKIF